MSRSIRRSRPISANTAADSDRLGQERQDLPADGAYPYKRDLPEVEFHLIDTGHFVLEDKADEDGAADPRLPRKKRHTRLMDRRAVMSPTLVGLRAADPWRRQGRRRWCTEVEEVDRFQC